MLLFMRLPRLLTGKWLIVFCGEVCGCQMVTFHMPQRIMWATINVTHLASVSVSVYVSVCLSAYTVSLNV